jgi:hypothetical protein
VYVPGFGTSFALKATMAWKRLAVLEAAPAAWHESAPPVRFVTTMLKGSESAPLAAADAHECAGMKANVPSRVAVPAAGPAEGARGDDEQAATQPSSRSARVCRVIHRTRLA